MAALLEWESELEDAGAPLTYDQLVARVIAAQRTLLRKDLLSAAFGARCIAACDWGSIEAGLEAGNFSAPAIRDLLRRVGDWVLLLPQPDLSSGDSSRAIVEKVYSEILIATKALPGALMRRAILGYFGPVALKMSLARKTRGRQLGAVLRIAVDPAILVANVPGHLQMLCASPGEAAYFVKTHSCGLAQTMQSLKTPAGPVRGGEVFVYYLLHLLCIGCEVHVFGSSVGDTYVATLDASRGGRFFEYEAIANNSQLREELLGPVLFDLVESRAPLQEMSQALAECPMAKAFCRQLLLLGLLEYLLCLTDLATNSGNFGFYAKPDGSFTLRVIDFGCSERPSGMFCAVIPGSGGRRRSAPRHDDDPLRKFCLVDRSNNVCELRSAVHDIMTTELGGWSDAISSAAASARDTLARIATVSDSETESFLEQIDIAREDSEENYKRVMVWVAAVQP